MQIRRSNFLGDRPACPVDPRHPVDRHGHYDRYANCDDHQHQDIARYLCRPCGRTLSVLPDHFLPYRALAVPLVQQHFDAQAQPESVPEPVATEKEKGCLKRAWVRFGQRLAALTTVLGQIMQIRTRIPKLFWSTLRRLGNLPTILRQLAQPFNTSLLHDYRCLQPWRRHSG
jgi:hypothetical protein